MSVFRQTTGHSTLSGSYTLVETFSGANGDRVQVGLEQIGVDVQRHGGRRVAEHALHHLRVAPALIARDTAVCRRSCGVTRGKVGSARWQRATAIASHEVFHNDGPLMYPPRGDGQISSSRSLPSHAWASSSTTTPAAPRRGACGS